MNNTISTEEYLASCCAIAKDAGKLIMGYFTGAFETRAKADHSPVTDADIAANQLIVGGLRKLNPDIPIIAEEDETPGREDHPLFWLVDPLDGTKSFVRKEPEFTVNIALVQNRQPLLGILYSPPLDKLYYAHVQGKAFRVEGNGAPEVIRTRVAPKDGLTVTRSRSHPSARTAEYLKSLSIKEIIPCSSAIKFCMVAEGAADIYPRFGRTMEWDSAAGHAILLAAGGKVETLGGQPLMYGKRGFENPPFIAYAN